MNHIKAAAASGFVLLLAGCTATPTSVTRPSPPSSEFASPVLTPVPVEPAPSATVALGEPSALPAVVAKPTAVPSPAASLNTSLRGVEWTHIPTSRKVVALTFDGGSGNEGIAAILATLRREKVPATFFLTGQWITRNDATLRSLAADPSFSVANHTQDHPRLPDLADDQVRGEVAGAESIIRAATGHNPRPAFRFPYGASDSRTLRLVNDLGYASIRWTVDTRGWMGRSSGQTEDSVVQRVMDGVSPGEIVVMHVGAATDGSTLDAAALPRVIAQLRARGYGFARVTDFLPAS